MAFLEGTPVSERLRFFGPGSSLRDVQYSSSSERPVTTALMTEQLY